MRTDDQNRRAQIAYHMAYTLLPHRAHNDRKEVRAEFEDSPDLAALAYYRQAARMYGLAPDPEDLRALRGHLGELDDCDLIVVEYPRFPAIDLLTDTDGVLSGGSYTLAPYFSAVLENRFSTEVRCFVLGQSLDAGTTLRGISETLNANLGRGCEPELRPFLKVLRKHAPRR